MPKYYAASLITLHHKSLIFIRAVYKSKTKRNENTFEPFNVHFFHNWWLFSLKYFHLFFRSQLQCRRRRAMSRDFLMKQSWAQFFNFHFFLNFIILFFVDVLLALYLSVAKCIIISFCVGLYYMKCGWNLCWKVSNKVFFYYSPLSQNWGAAKKNFSFINFLYWTTQKLRASDLRKVPV